MAQGALDATPDRVFPAVRFFLLPVLAETLRRNLPADATLSIALTDDQIVSSYRRHARALWLVAQSSLLIPLLIHVRQPQGNSFNLGNLHGILVIFGQVGVLSTMPVASIPSTRPALL